MTRPHAPRTIVPPDRLARLRRTVNISRWFRYPVARTAEHFRNFIGDDDLDLLQSLGVTAVRLTVAADQIIERDDPAQPITDCVAQVDGAVRRLTARGLAVVLVLHDVPRDIERDAAAADAFVAFWSEFAASYCRGTNPHLVFLEPINEPVFANSSAAWFALERRLAAAVRAAASDHTLVTEGPDYSHIDGLIASRPLDDPNVVYSFHFYDPFVFTHQGAPWLDHPVGRLGNIPYPAIRRDVRPLLHDYDPDAAAAAAHYASQRWDYRRVERRVAQAAAWGARHGVPVWAGEFGSFPRVAPRDSRLRWFADARAAFEQHGIGWGLWSYDEELGLDRRRVDGRLTIDLGVAEALGLTVSRQEPVA